MNNYLAIWLFKGFFLFNFINFNKNKKSLINHMSNKILNSFKQIRWKVLIRREKNIYTRLFIGKKLNNTFCWITVYFIVLSKKVDSLSQFICPLLIGGFFIYTHDIIFSTIQGIMILSFVGYKNWILKFIIGGLFKQTFLKLSTDDDKS